MAVKQCAYCGTLDATDREHVVPRCLYPKSLRCSGVNLLTVPACNACNNSWSEAEAHFRNILMLAGEPSPAVHEIWQDKVIPSFAKADGQKRLRDIWREMVPTVVDGRARHVVYPARDPQVMAIVRKIIRGLCYHHYQMIALADTDIYADIMRFPIPAGLLQSLEDEHRQPEVFKYTHILADDGGIHSYWLLTFYERTKFIAAVSS